MGHIQTGSYDKEDGTRVFTTDVIVESIEFDRKVEEKKEKTDAELVQDAMNEVEDPFENVGKQIQITDSDLPF